MWRNPLAWKDFNFMAGGRVSLAVKFAAYGFLIGFIAFLSHTFGRTAWRESFSTTAMVLMGIFGVVETVHQAGRIFAAERQWGTLSGLMVLPMSTARIAYSKALGCALGLIPAALWFLAGMLLVPEPLSVDSAEIPRILFVVASVLVEALLVAHLVAWFSILVRHGGTLLALGVYFVGNMFFGFWVLPLLLFVPQGWYFGVWALAGRVGIVVLLHYLVLSRLRTVAAG
jgi:ABC-type transport system involved in multi-copper enzyme maturation permease subunit